MALNAISLGNGGGDSTFVLSSGVFSLTVKTSLNVSANILPDGDYDGTNMVVADFNSQLSLYSGLFSSTIKTSLSVTPGDQEMGATSDSLGDTSNTIWANNGADKYFYLSGQFTATIKDSLYVGGYTSTNYSVSTDGTDLWWSAATLKKLLRTSGLMTGTIKDSQSTGATNTPLGISWDGTDTYSEPLTIDKSFLYSGKFTATIKTSRSITGWGKIGGWWGISTDDADGGRLPSGASVILPTGISSAEAFGSPSIGGNIDVSPGSILSLEVFGEPSISVGGVSIFVNGIPSAEAFGNPLVQEGSMQDIPLTGLGIASLEGFGDPIVRNLWVLEVIGIPSEEGIGLPTVVLRQISTFQGYMEDDLNDVFFSEDEEFANPITYTYEDGASITLIAIWDAAYEAGDPGAGIPIQSVGPMITCQTSKFTKRPKKGDKIVANGVRYEVVTHEPDGTGVSELTLKHERTV